MRFPGGKIRRSAGRRTSKMLSENDKIWVAEQINERVNALVEEFTGVIQERDARIRAIAQEMQELADKLHPRAGAPNPFRARNCINCSSRPRRSRTTCHRA
jgi:hypothetical protein